MYMNHLLINDCHQCADWFPADSFGNGTRCGAVYGYPVISSVVVPGEEERTPIPPECPRLAQQGFDVKSLQDLLRDLLIVLDNDCWTTEDKVFLRNLIHDRIQKTQGVFNVESGR